MPPTTMRPARRRPNARSRLIAAAVVASLLAAFAVTAPASALPSCRIGDTLTKNRKYTDWNRSLLDTYYKLPSTYAPSGRTNTSSAGLTSGFYVRTIIIADLKAMASAARSAGARLAVQSAYRSYSNQKATFDYWVRVDGYATAIKESARAGHSEHQLGTTLDFRSYGGSAPWNYNDWATTKAGTWMKANAWKYGFIMSYPKGKSAVTCYAYEPWHYRYVGRDDGREGPRKRAHAARIPVEAADRPAAADTDADSHSETVAHAHPEPVADPRSNAHAHSDA